MVAAVALLPKCFSSGSHGKLFALRWLSQLPTRLPSWGTPFTRRMPATISWLSKPVSAASYARRAPCS